MTNLLPTPLQGYAKTIWPTLIGLSGVLVSWISSGVFDSGEVRGLVATGANALVVYLVVNKHTTPVVSEAPVSAEALVIPPA